MQDNFDSIFADINPKKIETEGRQTFGNEESPDHESFAQRVEIRSPQFESAQFHDIKSNNKTVRTTPFISNDLLESDVNRFFQLSRHMLT